MTDLRRVIAELAAPFAADIQMLIGSWTPVVLAIGFCVVLAMRRRDRRSNRDDE